jgi:hypothetical protein
MRCDEQVQDAELRHARQILERVVGHVAPEARIDHVGHGDHAERMTVGRRFRNEVRPHDRTRARFAFYDNRLFPSVLQPAREKARKRVGGAAGREWNDEPYGP